MENKSSTHGCWVRTSSTDVYAHSRKSLGSRYWFISSLLFPLNFGPQMSPSPKFHTRCLVTSWAPLGGGETIRERTQHVVCGSLGCALEELSTSLRFALPHTPATRYCHRSKGMGPMDRRLEPNTVSKSKPFPFRTSLPQMPVW